MDGSVTSYGVVIEQDEDGWFVGYVPEMPGCHTQGKTREQLLERIKEAIQAYLQSGGQPLPGYRLVGVARVEVPA